MTDRFPDLSDEALGRRLATEVPRHAAPARLRAAIAEAAAPTSVRARWLAPTLASAATALVLGLAFVPMLPPSAPTEPALRLARVVVAEHTRAAMWGARRPADIIPAGLPWLTQETGIGLAKVFTGDERLSLLAAEPVYLDQRRGLALHYRDEDGHHVTYVALPAPGFSVPERQRVKISDRFRPALLNDSGFSVWVWRQGDLACFLVSDMVSQTDLVRFKDYFVRVRSATEPIPAY
jgi:hypothetical protein